MDIFNYKILSSFINNDLNLNKYKIIFFLKSVINYLKIYINIKLLNFYLLNKI